MYTAYGNDFMRRADAARKRREENLRKEDAAFSQYVGRTPNTSDYLNGCDLIQDCSCTRACVRCAFDEKIVADAPVKGRQTILHLAAGEMKQVFSSSLALLKNSNIKSVHAITIEPFLLLINKDQWFQCADIYVEPGFPVEPGVKLPDFIKEHALILKNNVFYFVNNGEIKTNGTSLDNDYFSKKESAKLLQSILHAIKHGEIKLDAHNKIMMTESNKNKINEFLHLYMMDYLMIHNKGEGLVQQINTVVDRINNGNSDRNLKISRFTSVFSFYLACHPERLAIILNKDRFNSELNDFNKKYPDQMPLTYSPTMMYLACQTDHELNAGWINCKEELCLDMAVSIDLDDPSASYEDKSRTLSDCFNGIRAAQELLTVDSNQLKIVACQKNENGYYDSIKNQSAFSNPRSLPKPSY